MAGAGALGWTAWPGGSATGEPIPLRASDVRVVDCDTIRVDGVLGGERIRLVSFDTPEVFDPHCPDEAELGHLPAASLEDVLRGAGRIGLTPEPGRDAHGRGRGRVAVDGHGVGVGVGDRLIMRGLARPDQDPHGSRCR